VSAAVPAPVVAIGTKVTPEPPRSWVDGFIERTRSTIASSPVSPAAYANAGLTTLGTYVTAGVTGSLLGATHAKWGLDSPVGAVDGWLAAGAGLLSVAVSGHMPDVAAHARAIGSQAFTILAFRKGYEVIKHDGLEGASRVRRIAAPGKGPGVATEDPIVAAARRLEETG
jgi:hypothetical protein